MPAPRHFPFAWRAAVWYTNFYQRILTKGDTALQKIGLAYAMDGEIASLLQLAGAKTLETVCGVPFYEIEPGIVAYAGGVGKVNAAMAAQLFIDRYHPDWVLNAGVAGCFQDLPIGTVVVAEGFLQHGVDTSPLGGPVGLVSTVNTLSFPTCCAPVKKALDDMGQAYAAGTVATGDAFMVKGDRADWIARTFSPLLCEMEGGAIAQVCLRNAIPFSAVKSVSDRLCQDNSHEEYFNFAAAMEQLNRIVLPLARVLRDTAGA